MPLSLIVKKICPECGKTAIETSRLEMSGYKLITLQCGHVVTEDSLGGDVDYDSIISSDNRHLRDYQIAGIQFAEAANARCLIADEQGLGKTVQALGVVKLHEADLLPCVVVTKTTLKHQWFHEIRRWIGEQYLTQAIGSSKEKAMAGFQFYVVSYDLLKTEGMFNDVVIKTVIIDECQNIKNHLAERSKAVQKLSRECEYVIALSGTPIKNHAGEYFTVLNILQPTRFPSYDKFLKEYTDHYWNGYGEKVGGLSNPELFKERTADFIIRRTRIEAAPELPVMDRQFYHVELNKKLNNAYRDAQKELDTIFYADEDDDTMTNMMAIMAKMRRITGMSKTTECIDYVTEFLLNEPTKKIVVFLHHHTVADLLENNLNRWLVDGGFEKCLNLNSSLTSDRRSALVDRFRNDSSARVMIASTLAAGEGLNLQFVDTAIMLERQWNPANEEQAEGRFIRLGQTSNHVVMVYMLASETIDEYFTELVEQKRAIVTGTLDGKEVAWDENSLMKELAAVLVAKGKDKWRL